MKDLVKSSKRALHSSRAYMPPFVERVAYFAYWNVDRLPPIALRKVKRKRLVVIVATPHKVGSTWLFHLIRDLGRFERRLVPKRYVEAGNDILTLEDPAVFSHLTQGYGYSIYKSHSYPINYELSPRVAPSVRFLTMYRDPRDAIVSATFYVVTLKPEEGGWDDEFRAMSEPRRVQTLIERGDFLLSRLEAWFRTPVAYKVRYEDLLSRPVAELTSVLQYLELEHSRQDVVRIVEKHSFESKSNRSRGEEKPSALLRKGIAGDWKNYFDEACIHAFKEARDGRWNKLLVEMGYETTLDW